MLFRCKVLYLGKCIPGAVGSRHIALVLMQREGPHESMCVREAASVAQMQRDWKGHLVEHGCEASCVFTGVDAGSHVHSWRQMEDGE